MKVGAVIAAGGKGARMGYKKNKALMPLCGREMIFYTLKAFSENRYIEDICLVVGDGEASLCEELVKGWGFLKVSKVIVGGSTRQESVHKGLLNIACDVVCIHDGARALVTDKIISDTVEAALSYGAAAPGVKSVDTLKAVDDEGFIVKTIDREKTVLIQTPQTFKRDEILKLHERAAEEKALVTDDCALCELYGRPVRVTEGSRENLKVTTPEDALTVERILIARGEAL